LQNLTSQRRDPQKLDIRVEVDLHALAKFWVWVDMAQGEVSALGLVEEVFDERSGNLCALRVTDLYLVRQHCTSADTEMDPMAVSELMASLEDQGQEVGTLLCWVDSHADMSVFWSGQDNSCIAGLANGRYLLSLVVNKKRDTMTRLDMFHPAHLCVTDIAWEPYFPLDEAEVIAAEAEFREKVTEQGVLSAATSIGFSTEEYVEQLKQARAAGLMDDDELEDELNWLQQEVA